ncbi:nucleophile aminohydrolase [Massariosphaeria phaeospora]|uniref:Nucleophile aminohydrolase n=1 Tax=Massariosphaeria phaeospora TaxID=100035 RepID=A0A7C8ICF3_9PLEO|nr:nucleophile aminohydrolase [Massariosphaeria phaeospora]
MSASTSSPGIIDGTVQNGTLARKATRGPYRDEMCCIFVHAGAGYHSYQNEQIHLQACNDAAQVAMLILRNGGSALDAVEMAVKMLEDREITNAGYGSNLAMDGVVECDASIVDHHGRSGAVGAVAQIKNPISLARLVLNHTMQALTLRRVPPNLLVSQGATDFAYEMGVPVLPHDALVSPAARERWIRWRSDLKSAERKARKTPGHPSAWRIQQDVTAEDESVRQTMRKQHEYNMLQGYPELYPSRSPTPPGAPLLYGETPNSGSPVSGSKSELSSDSWVSEERISTPDSPASEQSQGSHKPPTVRPLTIEESSRSAFINSTQKVPTIAQYGSSKSSRDAAANRIAEDIDMKEADYGLSHSSAPTTTRRSWGDGSGEESDSASSAITMKPSHRNETPVIAVQVPLSATPAKKDAVSPTSRVTTPLEYVKETARLSSRSTHPAPSSLVKGDNITDTVGAIAVDGWGNIACGASSGGIGMKYRGRVGPAALVGVGAAVIPVDHDDLEKTCVATVTSGTGEHMATTMAATVCAERLYQSVKKEKGGEYHEVTEDEALRSMIANEFMGHPSVKNSNSAGAIGILGIKRTRAGIMMYFGHNTDSFAMASMHSDETRPACAMSRSNGNGQIAQGGRMVSFQRKKRTKTSLPTRS